MEIFPEPSGYSQNTLLTGESQQQQGNLSEQFCNLLAITFYKNRQFYRRTQNPVEHLRLIFLLKQLTEFSFLLKQLTAFLYFEGFSASKCTYFVVALQFSMKHSHFLRAKTTPSIINSLSFEILGIQLYCWEYIVIYLDETSGNIRKDDFSGVQFILL